MIWSEKPAAPEEFVLPRVLTVIVERRWSILACLAAGLAAAAAGYFTQPPRVCPFKLAMIGIDTCRLRRARRSW